MCPKFIIFIIFFSSIFAQNRTAIHVICDTRNIPIYIDGHFVGNTPLKDMVDVTPGWHKVSFFPEVSNIKMGRRKITENILRLGSQDVLVEISEIVQITMTYKNVYNDVEEYHKSTRTGSLFGFSMALIMIMIYMWAYG